MASLWSRGRNYNVADFFPRWDREVSTTPQQDPEQMIAVFRGMANRKKKRKG